MDLALTSLDFYESEILKLEKKHLLNTHKLQIASSKNLKIKASFIKNMIKCIDALIVLYHKKINCIDDLILFKKEFVDSPPQRAPTDSSLFAMKNTMSTLIQVIRSYKSTLLLFLA